MTRANLLSVQPKGYIRGQNDLSPGAVGSRARLSYAAMLVGAGKISSDGLIAYFPQGYSINSPMLNTTDHISLGAMMANYLRSRPEMKDAEVYSEPISWGTLDDMKTSYDFIRSRGFPSAQITFVTDAAHMRRIRILWQLTRPAGDWNAKFEEASWHRMSFRERWIREPKSTIRDLIRNRLRP